LSANPDRGLPLIHGFYALFDAETLAPEALIDGGALTALRTPAVSGLATRYLAREEAHRLVIFGAGTQATGHLDAMLAVRPVDHVTVVSRSRAGADRLAAIARYRGVGAAVGSADAVADADIVCTCTTSSEPVFDGSLLRPGTHVNAVGAFQPDARELDDATVTAGTVVVETVAAALEEAGDVVIPLRAGRLGQEDLVELGTVVAGRRRRADPQEVTVFKCVGLAVEDLAVARVAVDRLAARDGR
jgi:ornithine cyclodeaminase/alanine dehydrogenase-like protein (mu-crystallin family)